MDYRITVTIRGFGKDEGAADKLLDGFVSTHPETGPVVSQDREADTMSIVFAVEAAAPDAAFERGNPIFATGATASGLPIKELLGINVEKTSDREKPTLQPA